MKIWIFSAFFLLCAIDLFGEHPFNVIKETVKIPMRDGVKLGATVYRPDRDGKFPAVVFRTPYGKDDYDSSAHFPMKAAKAGYVVILVDVRGRYSSEGVFEAYRNEKQDGYDVIEWAGRASYSTGRVGTYGQSYPGFVQWLALSQNPPSLKAVAPSLTPIDSHHFFYVGGGFSYSWLDWFMPLILPDLRKKANDPSGTWDEEAADRQWRNEKKQWYNFRPLVENPLLKKYAPYYYEWMKHPERSDYWKFGTVVDDFPRMKAPALLLSGWFDSVYGVIGATEAFNRMRKEGGSPEAREKTRLILGPWNHISIDVRRNKIGDIEFGPAAGFDYDSYLLKFYDQHLKEKPSEEDPPVSIFIMGANRWRYEKEWPLSRAKETVLYLAGRGDAQKDLATGKLASTQSGQQGSDQYVFDPNNALWDPSYERSYPFEQTELESRKDVLVYTSDPLPQDMEVTGQIGVELYVSSSAKDTDFAVTLCEVQPDGTSLNVTPLDAGFLRMRYRNGFTKQELMESGKIYKIRIDNLYTSNLFKKGNRIRLQVTSSRVPHYDPNTNTGTDLATEKKLLPATQTIYRGGANPSRLILPVIVK